MAGKLGFSRATLDGRSTFNARINVENFAGNRQVGASLTFNHKF